MTLHQRPFDHIDQNYVSVSPKSWGLSLEYLPEQYLNSAGVILCFEMLHSAENPNLVFEKLFSAMKTGGLLVTGSLFSYPYGVDQPDLWRCSPECLKRLGIKVGLTCLEEGWSLELPADGKVLNTSTGQAQELRAAYATFSKGALNKVTASKYILPQRFSGNANAQRALNALNVLNVLNRTTPENKNNYESTLYCSATEKYAKLSTLTILGKSAKNPSDGGA